MSDVSKVPIEFVQRLTAAQSALYAFICGLMGGLEQAADVLQETNLVLWNRAGEYDPARPFMPWAYTLARWQVMAWRKTQQRSRLVLDDDLVAKVAAEMESGAGPEEAELRALERCLAALPGRQRELIAARYERGETVRAMAVRLGQPENALAAAFYRIRRALQHCITTSMATEETA
jgi:RNA polymerase sigma-70 factor (ECF subfamily)